MLARSVSASSARLRSPGKNRRIRPYTERVYGLGPAEVIGSSLETGYKYDA